MESLENLNDLFIHELRDLYDAEKQLVTGLPLFAQAAKSDQLRRGFEQHLGETKEHVSRLEKVLRGLSASPEGKSCKAMAGLIAEAKETLDEDVDPEVLDAALIVAAQKIEHYEIASYGTLKTLAGVLGFSEAASLLEETLNEEKNADVLLTKIAEGFVNESAKAEQK